MSQFKLLHTADWHLGHKLEGRLRTEEQAAHLNWLIDCICEEQVDAVLVAGDVFDQDLPSNKARSLYFDFIQKLSTTTCKHLIIVGGNHDSASMLDASASMLKLLNVHVVGAIRENIESQIIPLYDAVTQELQAVVAAVPYLRDRDLKWQAASAAIEHRQHALRQAIVEHYAALAAALAPYETQDIPLITTGHLFVQGGSRERDRANYIHLGSTDSISAADFPPLFDYVALGHLHRPQYIDQPHIRYSGTLTALDFSELNYAQSVTLVVFEQGQLKQINTRKVPQMRYLRHYRGDMAYIQEKLSQFESKGRLPTWLKIEVEHQASYNPTLRQELDELLSEDIAEILSLRQHLSPSIDSVSTPIYEPLQQLQAEEVFEILLKRKKIDEVQANALRQTFIELQNSIQEQEEA